MKLFCESNLKILSRKSVIKYPGGKSRPANFLAEKILCKENKRVISPFIGGGSVEILLASKGVKVIAYDKFLPLVEFYQILLSIPKKLKETIQQIFDSNDYISDPEKFVYPINKKSETMFRNASKYALNAQTILERAAWFYIKNHAAYGGLMFVRYGKSHDRCISISKDSPNITDRMLTNLGNFYCPNLIVHHSDFEQVCLNYKDDFFYFDPPYYGEKYNSKGEGLYGIDGMLHSGFDHISLHQLVKNVKGFLMSYNNCEYIKNLYSCYTIEELDFTYNLGVNKHKKCGKPKELIISN